MELDVVLFGHLLQRLNQERVEIRPPANGWAFTERESLIFSDAALFAITAIDHDGDIRLDLMAAPSPEPPDSSGGSTATVPGVRAVSEFVQTVRHRCD
jgi:hypothetical protein